MPNVKTTLDRISQSSFVGVKALPFIQSIWHVSVRPAARSVRISFNTLHDCVPVVALYSDSPNMSFALMEIVAPFRTAFPFLGGKKSIHIVEFDELPEGTTFWIKITAYPDEKLTPNMLPAYQLGIFSTGTRTLDITTEELHVINDGDELSDGDLWFSFEGLNLETGLSMGRHRIPDDGRSSFHDDEFDRLNWVTSTKNVPSRFAILTQAVDDDAVFLFNPGIGAVGEGPLPVPFFPPETPERMHSRKGSDSVRTRDIFYIEDRMGVQNFNYEIDSGAWDVLWYKFSGHITVTTKPGPQAVIVFEAVDSKLKPFKFGGSGFHAFIGGAGSSGTVPGEGKSQDLRIGISDSGLVAWQKPGRALADTAGIAILPTPVAGPLTVLPDPAGGYDLFSTDARGGACRVRIDVEGKAASDWRSIGGRCDGRLTTVRLSDGRMAVLALDAEGAASYRLVQSGPHRNGGRWQPLGGKFRSLAAHPADRGRVHVIGIDFDGAGHYLQLACEREVTRPPRWHEMGGRGFVGIGFLEDENRELAAFAVDAERRVFGKLWRDRRWQSGTDDWQAFGEFDRLGRPDPFETVRPTRKAPRGRQNGADTPIVARTRGKPLPPRVHANGNGARASL